jgi:predicted aspartyl protease
MIKTTRNQKGHFAFTLHEEGLLREIVCDCKVSIAYDPNSGGKHPPLIDVKALWDTGATNCAITKDLVNKLGLAPFTKTTVHHADGKTEKDVYKVNIVLPNGVGFMLLNVTECQSTAGAFDIIIGMEVITRGDFAITNVGGKTMVSFRTPSNVSIDFNDGETIITPAKKSDEPEKVIVKNPYTGIGRNEQCPCGSDKKYKHCHGKEN